MTEEKKTLDIIQIQQRLKLMEDHLRDYIQLQIDMFNYYGLEVDLLCSLENVKRIGGSIEQIAIVDVSVKVKP